MPIPTPNSSESKDEFIQRCMGDDKMTSEYPDQAQRFAVCSSSYLENKITNAEKVSFDYDDTLSTDKGKETAKRLINQGDTVYIISARNDKEGMIGIAESLNIPASRVYATGSNSAKIEKIKELGISNHYDNNPDVISKLKESGINGILFK